MKKKIIILIMLVVLIAGSVVVFQYRNKVKQVNQPKVDTPSEEAADLTQGVKKTMAASPAGKKLNNNSQKQNQKNRKSDTENSVMMGRTMKSATASAKKTKKGGSVSVQTLNAQKEAYKLIPEKLLKPADEIKYAKNNGHLNEYDRRVLDFINQVRAANNLGLLKKMPTGLNESECLALMNAMRIMRGEKPLDNMPTGLKLK
jgi:hypothetical protein